MRQKRNYSKQRVVLMIIALIVVGGKYFFQAINAQATFDNVLLQEDKNSNVVSLENGDRFWNQSNPFHQPSNSTDYYGSGDLNLDGNYTSDDITLAENMVADLIPDLHQADVDGNGIISQADVDLIEEAVNEGSILPAWWNHLTSREQRISWINKVLAIDRTDEHPYDWWYLCRNFVLQLLIRMTNYRDDLFGTYYGGGQKGYNLPFYFVSIYGDYAHGINGILVGDNPLNLDDWLLIEPQSDTVVSIDEWPYPGDNNLYIMPLNIITKTDSLGRDDFLVFSINSSSWSLKEYSQDLILERPPLEDQESVEHLDVWNPRIIPGDPGGILYERVQNNMLRNTDVFYSDLPFTDTTEGNPLMLTDIEYSRILDVFYESSNEIHLLWTGKPEYIPGVFYGKLNLSTNSINDIKRVSLGPRLVSMGRILKTSINEIHIFWYEDQHSDSAPIERGIYWTKKTTSGWQEEQNISFGIDFKFLVLWRFSTKDHSSSRYLFDVSETNSGNIALVYTTSNIYNDYVYMQEYNGSWDSPRLIGESPIIADGVSLSYDNGGLLHIVYWDSVFSYDTAGRRGNVYHLKFDAVSWSVPYIIDESGNAGFPRTAIDSEGNLLVIWERLVNSSVVPVWSQYSQGLWFTPLILNVQEDHDAWYPSVDIMLDGKPVFSWSSRSPDLVTIDVYYPLQISIPNNTYIPVIIK